eukprot:GHUV01008011.1.p1 GENE.GHUV01008011.1~~GHUV01008011.1.p1  ORF type:complete len:114 (+),score=12.43 GHUV01008011.1:839-1180(+)
MNFSDWDQTGHHGTEDSAHRHMLHAKQNYSKPRHICRHQPYGTLCRPPGPDKPWANEAALTTKSIYNGHSQAPTHHKRTSDALPATYAAADMPKLRTHVLVPRPDTYSLHKRR